IGTQITEALAGLDRIRELMAMTTETDEDKDREALPAINGTIDFDGVEFEYEKDVPVLKGVTFHAEAGATTALVGSSGSGKSTILSLVLNFIQPTRGAVKIDGKDLQSVKLRDYRRHLGVVLQDNFLFDGTILDNIRFSNPEANIDTIKDICRVANADEFIEKFPNGYDTIVGERGAALSGGQRQRLALARAFLRNAPILILDEATSALDSDSEAAIQAALKKLVAGKTVLIIAHRFSTIRDASKIIIFDRGRIIAAGSHADLYGGSPLYKSLYDRQAAGV
ncbi:MAG TPA: ATP-binding cassette domain-containing protein, partial [Opitutaceae bacterium]|nr:ATP-binding cassette domain-containing protein [Opitutaceae bacterium]